MQNEQIELLSLASLDDDSVLSLPVPDRIFGFHAQQAVEKLLKMLTLGNRQRHQFTHNFRILREDVEVLGEALPSLPFPIVELTDFAAEFRYEAARILDSAERDQVREHVNARLQALNA